MSIERIDIAICTWNRADLLEQTLKSLQRLVVPYDCQLRAVLVDNHSTDRTSEVLNEFANGKFTKRHSVLLLSETQQGHTFARNKAVENLDSDLVIWTDDDVIVDAFLVQHYVNFANGYSAASFFGGKILPKFDSKPPAWVNKNWEVLKGCFAERDLGEQSIEFNDSVLPYGANFAVRTAVQQANPFNTELGRRGESVLGEDELEMMKRLLSQGLSGRWVPEAKIQHVIEPSRVSESYVRDYFVGQGKALVAKGNAWGDNAGKLKLQSIHQYWVYQFKKFFSRSKSKAWLSHLIRSGLAKGQSEALRATEMAEQKTAERIGDG